MTFHRVKVKLVLFLIAKTTSENPPRGPARPEPQVHGAWGPAAGRASFVFRAGPELPSCKPRVPQMPLTPGVAPRGRVPKIAV